MKNIDDNITGGYLVDTNGDGTYDKFYNSTSGINTTTKLEDDGTYKIDTNGDGTWDYIYDPASGAVTPCKPEEEFPWLLAIIGAIIAIVVIIGILFFTGYVRIEGED